MSGRVALAFDPSPTGYTWAVVRETPKGRGPGGIERVDVGTVEGVGIDAAKAEYARLIETYAPVRIAVEGVAGYLSAERQSRQRGTGWDIQALISTAMWAGTLIGWAAQPDKVLVLPANAMGRSGQSWRYYLTGRHGAGDADVSRALDFALDGGLKVRSVRTVPVKGAPGVTQKQTVYADNDHKRDAMGLGIVALRV